MLRVLGKGDVAAMFLEGGIDQYRVEDGYPGVGYRAFKTVASVVPPLSLAQSLLFSRLLLVPDMGLLPLRPLRSWGQFVYSHVRGINIAAFSLDFFSLLSNSHNHQLRRDRLVQEVQAVRISGGRFW